MVGKEGLEPSITESKSVDLTNLSICLLNQYFTFLQRYFHVLVKMRCKNLTTCYQRPLVEATKRETHQNLSIDDSTSQFSIRSFYYNTLMGNLCFGLLPVCPFYRRHICHYSGSNRYAKPCHQHLFGFQAKPERIFPLV